ncbi:hypothetical protein [Nostoc sp.]
MQNPEFSNQDARCAKMSPLLPKGEASAKGEDSLSASDALSFDYAQ